MSEDKQIDNDPERTLLTLDQLSQTIEVMTSVVNRLRQHLSEQMRAQAEAAQAAQAAKEAAELLLQESQAAEENSGGTLTAAEKLALEQSGKKAGAETANKDSFVVEIKQQDNEPDPKNSKTLH